MAETKSRNYKRATAAKKLQDVIEQARRINANLDNTYGYLYYVKKLVVFGSYLDKERSTVHDLDIGYELELKPKYKGYTTKDIGKARLSTMPKRFMERYYGLWRNMWPREEVLRYLKNNSVVYSFHSIEIEPEIIYGGRHKLVYDMNDAEEQKKIAELFEDYKNDILYNIIKNMAESEIKSYRRDLEQKIYEVNRDTSIELGILEFDNKDLCNDIYLSVFCNWIARNRDYISANSELIADILDGTIDNIA